MDRRNFNASMAGILAFTQVDFANMLTDNKNHNLMKLQKGDKVGIVAPSGPVKSDRFENVTNNLEALGLIPVYGKYINEQYGFLAGSDDHRLEDLHSMYINKDVKAIWCLRGGYGATRILDQLDYKLIRKNPKPLIGFSDITAPLLSIYKKTGIPGYHAAMLASKWTPFTMEETRAMIMGERNDFVFMPILEGKRSDGEFAYQIVPGQAQGELIGGNLTLLASLCGTAYVPSFKNKIVFIEEVGEKPYRIDRMMTQLRQSTDIEKSAGFVLGIFNDCQPGNEEFSLSLKDTLVAQFRAIGKPTYYGAPFGHIDMIAPLPLGCMASFDAEEMILRFEI